MEVQYYDSTELVDDKIRDLINQKVDEMRESYENHLLQYDSRYEALFEKVEKFQMLEKMGNCLIGFDEMNSGHLINMLTLIESRP